jgi:hypothetical protein
MEIFANTAECCRLSVNPCLLGRVLSLDNQGYGRSSRRQQESASGQVEIAQGEKHRQDPKHRTYFAILPGRDLHHRIRDYT